jgi:hypothetical protein
MSKYTPLCTWRWIVLGPRLWVWLILIVSLVAVASFPTDGSPSALWVWPDERSDGGWHGPPSRVGRWVWRLSRVLQGSRVCWVCRVGLLAGLIAGSGLAVHCPDVWPLIWLPVGDWALGVIGCVCPRLPVSQTYQDLRELLHRAYQGSVIGLCMLAVHRGLNVGLSGVVLSSLVVCERDESRVELESGSGSDGQTTYRVHLIGEFVYEVTPRDEFEKRMVILDLRRLRTPGRENSPWGIVRQEDLAQVFDVFQERISQWQTYVREGQWAQLLSVSDKSLLTEDLRQHIVEVWAANIWQTVAQVRERLAQQGVAVAERLVEEAGRQSGLMTIRAHLKEQFVSGPEGVRPRDGYLTEQLFKLMNQLQAQLDQGQVPPREETVDVIAFAR